MSIFFCSVELDSYILPHINSEHNRVCLFFPSSVSFQKNIYNKYWNGHWNRKPIINFTHAQCTRFQESVLEKRQQRNTGNRLGDLRVISFALICSFASSHITWLSQCTFSVLPFTSSLNGWSAWGTKWRIGRRLLSAPPWHFLCTANTDKCVQVLSKQCYWANILHVTVRWRWQYTEK